jgi:thiol-disulfide isomerase/thioredoxin
VTVAAAQPAPDFDLPQLDGDGTISLTDLKGKVVYLDFWASWCGPCAYSLPQLERLRIHFRGRGFEVIAINLDQDKRAARRFLSSKAITYPILIDPDKQTPVTYAVQGMPTAYLLDRDGNIRHVHTGFRKGDSDKISVLIEQLLNEGWDREVGMAIGVREEP